MNKTRTSNERLRNTKRLYASLSLELEKLEEFKREFFRVLGAKQVRRSTKKQATITLNPYD